MKNIQHFILNLAFVVSIMFSAALGFAQTDDYHCNLICVNQPDYILVGVGVDLYNGSNELIGTTVTDEAGFFHFDNLTIGESYVAKFSYDAENGFVDLEDAFTLLEYLSGNVELNEYQLIAANVDGNNEVNINDFSTILYNYYILQQDFPIGNWIMPDWEFTLTGEKGTGGPQHTVSLGDIEMDDDLPKDAVQARMQYPALIEMTEAETIIPIFFNNSISTKGIGLVLEYNENAIEILNIESPIEDLNFNVSDGMIRIGWTGLETYKFSETEAFVNIHIKQSSSVSQSQTERFTVIDGTHILDGFGQKINGVTFSSPEFKTIPVNTVSTDLAYPNPCANYFTIQLSNEIQTVEIAIFNIQGQEVLRNHIEGINGIFTVNTRKLTQGMYFYQLNTQSKSIFNTISILSK